MNHRKGGRAVDQSLEIHVENRAGATVAHLRGQAHNDQADRLRDALGTIVRGPRGPVIVDLRGLSFIATAGLGELLSFREQLAARGDALHLAGADAHIADMFRRTRLGELFPMFPDADTAIAAMPSCDEKTSGEH